MKKLENLSASRDSRSFIDCLHAVLTASGLFDGPKHMLSGMTGMAFKFIIHKRLLPSSIDIYPWGYENWQHINTLGIYSEYYEGRVDNPVFPLYQNAAIKKIRESIDRGIGVIAWGLSHSATSLETG